MLSMLSLPNVSYNKNGEDNKQKKFVLNLTLETNFCLMKIKLTESKKKRKNILYIFKIKKL